RPGATRGRLAPRLEPELSRVASLRVRRDRGARPRWQSPTHWSAPRREPRGRAPPRCGRMRRADMQEYQLYIDGAFSVAEGGKTADSINPATEEPWARVSRASRRDTQRAIAAARRAFDEGPWPRMTAADRKKILSQIADGLEARSQELAAVETQDSGGTIRKTSGDMMLAANQLKYFAEMAEKVPLLEEIQVPQFPAQSKNYLQREPI